MVYIIYIYIYNRSLGSDPAGWVDLVGEVVGLWVGTTGVALLE